MKAKRFLLEVKYDPTATRFLYHDDDLCEVLYHLAQSAVSNYTAGAQPGVMVVLVGNGVEPIKPGESLPLI